MMMFRQSTFGGRMRRSRLPAFAFLDLVVLLFVCVALLGWSIGVRSAGREVANRVKCGSNLRQIGQALLLYSNENKNLFPRTRWDGSGAPTTQFTGVEADNPFAADGPAVNDVTAALFLLLRTQDITTDVFVCPTSSAEPFRLDDARRYSNFPGKINLSYSYANPYPTEAVAKAGYVLTNSMSSEFALMADINSGASELLALSPNAGNQEQRSGNSENHDWEGQNVLYADGHVEFQNNGFVGINKDNIYTYGVTEPQVKSIGIVGPPTNLNDSVLLPVSNAKPPRPPAAPTARTALMVIVPLGLMLAGYVLVLLRRAAAKSTAIAST
jgi:prepilin-type processing-associated H-X9-DG protein